MRASTRTRTGRLGAASGRAARSEASSAAWERITRTGLPTGTVRVVRNALNAVRSQQRVLIRVSPDDKDAVRTSLAAMISSAPNGATFLDVTADPRMKPGDCILECELGVVDASLETQLKAIEHAFDFIIHNTDIL